MGFDLSNICAKNFVGYNKCPCIQFKRMFILKKL